MTCQTCGANQDGHKKNCQLLFIQDYILCSHNNVDMEAGLTKFAWVHEHFILSTVLST